MTALKRILVPHNLSDTSETAMTYAMALARTVAAKLHLFHASGKGGTDIAAEDLRGADPSMDDAGSAPSHEIAATAEEKAQAMLRQTTLEGFADDLSACDEVSLPPIRIGRAAKRGRQRCCLRRAPGR